MIKRTALRSRPSDFAHVLFVEPASVARPILSAWQYRAWASSDRLFSWSFSTELIPGIAPKFYSKRPLGIAPAAAHVRQHKDAGVFVRRDQMVSQVISSPESRDRIGLVIQAREPFANFRIEKFG
jgi:hypothetical protein